MVFICVFSGWHSPNLQFHDTRPVLSCDICFALQVEQASKYTASRPPRPLADAMISRRLLQARGWRLICLSEHEWVRLRDLNEKVALVEAKLEQAKALQPPKAL